MLPQLKLAGTILAVEWRWSTALVGFEQTELVLQVRRAGSSRYCNRDIPKKRQSILGFERKFPVFLDKKRQQLCLMVIVPLKLRISA